MPKLNRVTNPSEERAFRELEKLAHNYGYHVNIKMCVQDALSLRNWKEEPELSSFARDAHFDFLICNENSYPLFAVEFDGPTHLDTRQAERDKKKNYLCDRYSLPILRINSNHLVAKYNKAIILRWVISAWELQKDFDVAQEKGMIPYEEGFDPILLWHHGKTVEDIHPHWISLKSREHIRTLHKEGRIESNVTSSFSFNNDKGDYVGIEWIDVGQNEVIYIQSGLKSQQFPLYFGDLFNELMTIQLHEKLQTFLQTGMGSSDPSDVENWLNKAKKKYRFSGSRTGPTCVHYSISWNQQKQSWL